MQGNDVCDVFGAIPTCVNTIAKSIVTRLLFREWLEPLFLSQARRRQGEDKLLFVFWHLHVSELEGWASSSRLIAILRAEAGGTRGWHTSASALEALVLQFPTPFAGSRGIMKDAVILGAG